MNCFPLPFDAVLLVLGRLQLSNFHLQQMNISDQQLSEGFQSNRTIIQQGDGLNSTNFSYRPIDFHPRVLLRSFIFRKLPEEMNDWVPTLPSETITTSHSQHHNKKGKEEKPLACSPYEMYEDNSEEYQLVYAKNETTAIFRDKTEDYTSHEIPLRHLTRYQQQNYYPLKSFQQPQQPARKQLVFDSRFQSGNLLCTYQSVSNRNQYHLFLENDTNRTGYNQWFFFALRGAARQTKYTFKLLNFRKGFSFFKLGMKPVVFSLKKHRRTGNGWERRADNVTYGISPVCDRLKNSNSKLYALEFQLQFQEEDDFITISSGMPYSYSRLVRRLKQMKMVGEENGLEWKQMTIAYTLSNNQVPYLIITKAERQNIEKTVHKTKKKKRLEHCKPIILLFARQHPGQTNSSFLMESFLRELAEQSKPQTKYLLSNYEFHIFPMVNVDGVIYGNFRCDLSGFDLNRVWRNPVKELHPQICAIVDKIEELHLEQKIVCCFDFHSHSKQYNVFSYCCKQDEVESRVLPFLMSKINQTFHFPSNTFGLTRDKYTTARATIFSMVKHHNVLTVQSSSFASRNQQQIKYLDPCHFAELAKAIIQALKIYFQEGYLKKICEQQIKARLNEFQDYERQNQQSNAGSDSEGDVESGQLIKCLKIFLPENTVKRYQAKYQQLQAEKTIFQKETQRKETILIVDNKPSSHTLERYERSQLKEKPKYYNKVVDSRKQQILTIMRTKQTPKDKKLENPIIRLPLNPSKNNKYQHNKTEIINQKQVIIIEDQERLIQKPRVIKKNRSSLLYTAASKEKEKEKDNSKEPKPVIRPKPDHSRFKLRSFQQDSGGLEKISSSVGDKRSTGLRRMSKIQKILRIRKRANTLKNIIHQQTKSQFNNQIFQIKIGDAQANSRLQKLINREDKKPKLNKSSTVINKASFNEKQLLVRNCKKSSKTNTVPQSTVHTSLISQLWKINYGRYSKQLS